MTGRGAPAARWQFPGSASGPGGEGTGEWLSAAGLIASVVLAVPVFAGVA